jgi:hypothetical protein
MLALLPARADFSIDWYSIGDSAAGVENGPIEMSGAIAWFGPDIGLQQGFWNESIINRSLFVLAFPDFAERPDGGMVKVNVLLNDTANFGPATIASVDHLSAEGGTTIQLGPWLVYQPPASNPEIDTFGYTLTDGLGHFHRGVVTITIRPPSNSPTPNVIAIVGSPGNLSIRFAGIPGFQYRVQVALTITGPWEDIASMTAPSNGLFTATDDINRGPSAFYRTISP